ncbi:MAG: hypothetical protein HZA54_17765, partial [Planctomycetes bacterium]|nr:hypothetical protein [Planctomycetota bacterium]
MYARGFVALGLVTLLSGCSIFGKKDEEPPAPTPAPSADNRMDLIEDRLKQHERELEDLRRQVGTINDRVSRAGAGATAPAAYGGRSLPTPSPDAAAGHPGAGAPPAGRS